MFELRQQKFPVFGLSEQRSWLYQPEINLLTTAVSAIVDHVIALESEIVAIIDNLAEIENDIDILLADTVVSFDVVSTYNSTVCPAIATINLFEVPQVTAGAVQYSSRPLYSTDNSVVISYDNTCGFINLQASVPSYDVTLASAAGPESLVYGTGLGPALQIKGLSATSAVSLTSPGLGDTVVIGLSGANVHLYDAIGATTSFVNTDTGPTLKTKSLVAGSGISLSAPGDTVTVAATGTNVTLASSVSGTSLVSTGTGPNLSVCSLVAGANIDISATGVITYTQANRSYGHFYDNVQSSQIVSAISTLLLVPAAFTTGSPTTADLVYVSPGVIQYTGTTTKLFAINMTSSVYVNYTGGTVLMQFVLRKNSVTLLNGSCNCTSNNTMMYNTAFSASLVSLATNDTIGVWSQSATVSVTYPFTVYYNNVTLEVKEL